MKDGRIVVARLWHRYRGLVSSRAPIILGLDRQKYHTVIIYLMKNSEKPNFFEQRGCTVYYISQKKFFRVFNLRALWRLIRLLKREKVDILHCHRHQAVTYGTIAAKLAVVPVVIAHVHGLNRSKSPKRKFVNSIVLRWVDKILTVGEAVRNDVLQENAVLRPEQIISLGNSIDYDRFASTNISKSQAKQNIALKPETFVFGTVGRLAPTKGLSYLIDAFVKVKQVITSAQLIIIGQGRLQNQLEQQAANTPYADSIHFLGHRDNMPELYRAMDVFVLSSIAEGLPRSLLEAMASEVPCICTNVGSVSEVLAESEFGLLVPPRDHESLAEAMIKLGGITEKERVRLAKSAKKRVCDCYSHGVIIQRLDNIYQTEYRSKKL